MEEQREIVERTVTGIKFRNDENGYTVIEAEGADEDLIIVGYVPYIAVGETVRATGQFTNHANYGRQFAADTIEVMLPEDATGILAYLSGGALKGIGKVTARRMVDAFGADTLDVIENEPERLCQIKGITKARADEIHARYMHMHGVTKVIASLKKYELPAYLAVRLYSKFGNATKEVIEANPFVLCGDDFALDFDFADEIASRAGMERENACRVEAGIKYVLHHNLGNGHTFLPRDALVSTAARLLECEDYLAEEALDRMVESGALMEREIAGLEAVYLQPYYEAERSIADRLRALDAKQPAERSDAERQITRLEEMSGIRYAEMQRRAIRESLRSGVFILTGGPGTGKTTALNGMIQLFAAMELRVVLAAPTGRAAKRMTEVTGMESKTVHRLLEMEYRPGEFLAFRRNEKNPLEADVVIIDEASMLDVMLCDALLRAIPRSARLILIGDTDQLPPVGAGNVLRDIIDSDVFTCIELTEIFRQAQGSLIVVNAHQINRGDYPEIDVKDNDFFFLQREGRGAIAQTIVSLCAVRLPKNLGLDPRADIQVISPTRKGEAGTVRLNALLQEALNPPAPGKKQMRWRENTFRVGDKVMQIRNNYEQPYVKTDTGELGTGVFNGDIGMIAEIDPYGEIVTICFDDRICEYPFEAMEQVELAYAVTVHKSQGSEFTAVIMPCWFGSDKLQSRNLLYTAVTRAKSTFIAVGSPAAMFKMVDNNREIKRFSGLKYMLQE